MPIAIDLSKPLLRPADLEALVRAVVLADASDEADWVEWKTDIDLSTPEGRGTVARHILGFSNREPDRARRTAGGWGYLLVGVEPGRVTGQTLLDPAELDQVLRVYLGEDGPLWVPTTVSIDRKTVLVISVDPPGWGDPIRTLRKQFDKYRSGDVFVRRNGATHRASAAEMEMLQRRLVRVAPGGALDIELSLNSEPLTAIDYRPGDLEDWLDQERSRQLKSLENHAKSRNSNPAIILDARSRDDYVSEVDAFIRDVRARLPGQLTQAAVRMGLGEVQADLRNLTEENFPSVRLVLEFDAAVAVAEHDFVADDFPDPPTPFGTPSYVPRTGPLRLADIPTLRRSAIELEKEDEIHRVVFDPVDLRPEGRVRLPRLHLFPGPDRAGEAVSVTWSATSTGVPGVAKGTLRLEVAEEPVTTQVLVRRVPTP